jgi:two-component system cell cycle response regulator CtrA
MPILILDSLSDSPGSLTALIKSTGVDYRPIQSANLQSILKEFGDVIAVQMPLAIFAQDVAIAIKGISDTRSANQVTPILAVLPEHDAASVISLLEAGADDVINLSQDPNEILARIYAAARRAAGVRKSFVTIDDLSVDLSGGQCSVDGTPLSLTSKETEIMSLLAKNSGRVVSRQAVYDTLYALTNNLPFQKVIDVHIFNLRKKMDAAQKGSGQLIETIAGRGFMLRSRQPLSEVA